MATPVKHALVDHPDPAWKVARAAGFSDVYLSRIASGRVNPSSAQKEEISKILKRPVQELFPIAVKEAING